MNCEMDIEKFDPESRLTTNDTMFSGAVSCRQFQDGYRFSVDAVLAAHFCTPKNTEIILDLGAGCGIISLILMYRWGDTIERIQAVEYQPQLCSLSQKNFRENGFNHKCSCVQGDVKTILDVVRPESFTLVICNPPYYTLGSGRKSEGGECSLARHLVSASLDDFTKAASLAVKNGGNVVFVYPAELLASLMTSLSRVRLEVKQMQAIYSYSNPPMDAKLVLVRCVKNGGAGCKLSPPFYIYKEKNGSFSQEMEKLYLP
ncbi:tRNA1(Val) A37 N6-methylase TrmN6 [Desulfopila aestuarii DSM 18488]|uniref:tRNA1(Val) A37 N6-methylase TrmN6 n=2 Tax=Desulfopila aestuarii TaxID=231440 RepID=A0A1M7YKN5_9BACT|nr:tRNA1(Val) A37 N6-methylase TrmN6 [Desulfopila aestuarii DSM 18488]